MQNVYNKITPATGAHIAGIYKIKIVPKEWLVNSMVIDFMTGKVVNDVQLIAGKNFIDIELLQDTYDYLEKPKATKPGTFFEISISGTTNSLDAPTLQTLNTFRYHQFVGLVKDRQGRQKLVGNKDAGLVLQFTNKEISDKGGTQLISIDMNMDLENPAPFFEVPVPVLAAPILTVNVFNANQINLSWTASPAASIYTLQRAKDAAFTLDLVTVYSGVAVIATDNQLYQTTHYYYRIKATAPNCIDSIFALANATTTAATGLPTANMWSLYNAAIGVTGIASITKWDDQSGNGNHLYASSNNPMLAANVINGLPVVQNAAGLIARMATIALVPDNVATGMTIFIVASQRIEANPLSDTDGIFLGSGASIYINRGNASSVTTRLRNGSNLSKSGITDNTFYTIRAMLDASGNQSLSVNNGIETNNATSGAFTPAVLELFCDTALGGAPGNKRFAMAIVYTRALAGFEIDVVETILKTKFAHY